jgi:hypothetical protein
VSQSYEEVEKEARQVMSDIILHGRNYPNYKLGIATQNSSGQQRLVLVKNSLYDNNFSIWAIYFDLVKPVIFFK